MATSGALSTSNQFVKYTISITQNSQSVTNNTSNVTVSVRFYRTNTGYKTYGTGTLYVKINGTTYTQSVTPYDEITNSGMTLFTKTLDIAHGDDGTKTLTCSAWISHNAPLTSTEQSYSQVLTTIPRKSTMSVANGTLGTAQTLMVTRKSTSFTHTITYTCGSYSGTIVSKSSNTSISWTPPLDFANGAPNGTSVYVSFTLTTYSGNTSVGSNSYAIYCSIPSSVVPTVSITDSDYNGYSGTYGAYVQSKSRFNISISASGKYSSTIKSYVTTIDGMRYNTSSFTTGVIQSSGTLTIKCTVTDSRGRTATVSKNVTVLAYSPPKITALNVYRSNSDGSTNSAGSYLTVKFSALVTPLNNKNGSGYIVQYKKSTSSSYTSNSITSLDNKLTVTDATYTFVADTSSSYDVIVKVADSFVSSSAAATGSSIFKLFSIFRTGKGLGIGKIAEFDNTVDVALKSKFSGGVTGDINMLDGDIHDVYGTRITNGMSVYASTPIDPNTTLDSLILTEHSNGPVSGKFYYISTMFYRTKTTTANRSQVAVPYNETGAMYRRYYYNNAWSNWIKQGDEPLDYIVAQGVSGNWYYRKWNSGYAECWMNHEFTPTWTTIGNFYYCYPAAVTLPFTFVKFITFNANVQRGPYVSFASGHRAYGSNVTSVQSLVIQVHNASTPLIQLSYYCYGTWK